MTDTTTRIATIGIDLGDQQSHYACVDETGAVGADKAYDTQDFVQTVRELGVMPHVMQNTSKRHSAIDKWTTRHPGYQISLAKR